MVLLRKKRERKKTNKYRFGGGGGARLYKVKKGPKINVTFQAQLDCTWIRSLLFNKKRNVFLRNVFLWGSFSHCGDQENIGNLCYFSVNSGKIGQKRGIIANLLRP
jgi:hypothetical protein